MKIGILCHAGMGGSGTVACELAMDLARRGHRVHVMARALPPRLAGIKSDVVFHPLSTNAVELPGGADPTLSMVGGVLEVVRREGLEILHAHYALPHAVVGQLVRGMLSGPRRLALVTTLHGTDVTMMGQGTPYHELTRHAVVGSDLVTVVSRSLRDSARDVFGPVPMRVIPNFVDLGRFRRRMGDDGGAGGSGMRTLIHVSNFRRVKRAEDCVEILARLRRIGGRECRLVMVGDGPEQFRVRERAEQLGVGRDVEFLGEQRCVAAHLLAADVLLLPSGTESFGVAALEAMACGIPVVGSRTGGLPEVVEDGVCGRLMAVGDVDGMAAAVREILEDVGLAASMADAGRRIAEERFGPDRIVPQYEDCYREVLARSAGVAG